MPASWSEGSTADTDAVEESILHGLTSLQSDMDEANYNAKSAAAESLLGAKLQGLMKTKAVSSAAADPVETQAEEEEKEQGKPGPEEEALTQAVNTGQFDLRGSVGRLWNKEKKLNEVLAASYEGVGKSYEAQRRFRLQWAEQRRDGLRVERIQSHRQTVSDNLDCRYISFEKTWEEEGKGQAGFEAAKNYWASAIALWSKGALLHGKQHVKYNVRTKRPEVLYVKEKLHFSDAHIRTHREIEHVGAPASSSAPLPALPPPATTPLPQAKAKGKAGAPEEGRRRTTDDKEEAQRKRLKLDLAKSEKVRVTFNAASAAAHDLINVVSKGPAWSWANNEHSLHPVRQARRDVNLFRESSAFYQDWTVAENFALTVKKKYAADVVEQEFRRWGGGGLAARPHP